MDCFGRIYTLLIPAFYLLSFALTQDVMIDNVSRPWNDSTRDCSLYGSSRTTAFDISNLQVQHNSTKLFWIGATVEHTPWFTLLGCYFIFYSEKTVSLKTSVSGGPVLQCFRVCDSFRQGYTDFAINSTHCKCSSNMTKGRLSAKFCSFERDTNDIYGRGKLEHAFGFAVFRTSQVSPVTERRSPQECAAVRLSPSTQNHIFLPCDTGLPFLCRGNESSVPQSWPDAMVRCGSPLDVSFTGRYSVNVDHNVTAWTGIFRRNMITWNKGRSTRHACVAVQIENNRVQHVARSCTERHPALCEQTETYSSTIQQNNSTPTTSHQDSTSLTMLYSTTETVDSSVKMYVIGGIAGSILVLAVVAVFIIICIKRKQKDRKLTTTEDVYYSELKTNDVEEIMESSTIIDSTGKNDVYDTTSSVKSKEDDKNRHDAEYGRLNSAGDYDVYNHTWEVHPEVEINDNDYSTMMTGNDVGLYDNANRTTKCQDNRVNVVDENYGMCSYDKNKDLV